MKALLHIISTPRVEESRTLQVSREFLEVFRNTHSDWAIREIDLFQERLPTLTARTVGGKYVLLGGGELEGELKVAWEKILTQIERFKSADGYLISTPMWNFNIPYVLKQYIDVIMQPRYLFRYTESGPEGLLKDKKMVIITSRGGEYVSDEMKKIDFQEPYLRTIFGLAGISDITFINAQPMDAQGPEVQKERIIQAQEAAHKIAESF